MITHGRHDRRPHRSPVQRALGIALLIHTLVAGAALGDAGELTSAVERALKPAGARYGEIHLDLRYRYEYVDQEDIPTITEAAKASTLRLRAGYLTPKRASFDVYAEYEGLVPIFNHNQYNDTSNGKTRFPLVADPSKHELNQLWLRSSGIPQTVLQLGRQRLTYDNHRFIGNVGWRQLEQTFDSATVVNTTLSHTTIRAAYVLNVHDVTSRNVTMHSPLLNVRYDGLGFGSIVAYGYWLNYADASDSSSFRKSSQTYGLRFDGGSPIGRGMEARYTAEWARQLDFRKNPESYQANYFHLAGGLTLEVQRLHQVTFTTHVDWERLEADNGFAFQTPLATLHAFHGWSDRFLVTPTRGLDDLYGSLAVTLGGFSLLAAFHDFRAEKGSAAYGNEIDASIGKTFGRHYRVLFKYAQYNARRFATDTQKLWAQVEVMF